MTMRDLRIKLDLGLEEVAWEAKKNPARAVN